MLAMRYATMAAKIAGSVAAALVLAACDGGAATSSPGVSVERPAVNAKSASPLEVEGIAPNNWYFEGMFPLRIEVNGRIVAEAPARPKTDWMTEGPVGFTAELHFDVGAETKAVLILEEDMPGDGEEPRAVHVPVTLLPK